MWEIIEAEDTEKDTIIPMCDMKPMQVGVIVGGSVDAGKYVVRSRVGGSVEIIGNSDGWNNATNCNISVRLLRKGESITVKLFNEE